MDDLIRSRMHEALGVEWPDPELRARVIRSLPVRERRVVRIPAFSLRPAAAIVAIVLAAALVIALIYGRWNATLSGPARTGPVGQGIVVNQVDFKCSLPVDVGVYPSVFVQVQLPGGMVVNRSTQPVDQFENSSYDVQAGRWVPVVQSAVSPDGRYWAYGTGMLAASGRNGTVHVVDLVTGKDIKLWSGSGGASVVAFLTTGIYFVEVGAARPGTLWAVEWPKASSAHRVGAFPSTWPQAEAVFGPAGAFATVGGHLEHMDLVTGEVTTWFTNDVGSIDISLLGTAHQGLPLVDEAGRILLVTGPEEAVLIADGSDTSFRPTSAFSDDHGVWFSEPGSIWLYQYTSGPREVFAMPDMLIPQPPPKVVPSFTPIPRQTGAPKGVALSVIGPCT